MTRRPGLKVTVCRGGRCGSAKHPDFDHERQLEALTQAASIGGGACSVTDCLALCSASNVIVVRRGSERIFLGRTANEAATAAVKSWLAGGAAADLPELVALQVIDPSLEFEEPCQT